MLGVAKLAAFVAKLLADVGYIDIGLAEEDGVGVAGGQDVLRLLFQVGQAVLLAGVEIVVSALAWKMAETWVSVSER